MIERKQLLALIDKLRDLATVLPPSFRATTSEVADLLGSAIVFAEHGDEILAAAEAGPQAVADFFHQHIADTRPQDAAEPERGQAVENVPPTGVAATPVGPSQAQFNELQGQLAQLAGLVSQLVHKDAPQEPAPAGPEDAAPASGSAPAPAPSTTEDAN